MNFDNVLFHILMYVYILEDFPQVFCIWQCTRQVTQSEQPSSNVDAAYLAGIKACVMDF